MFVLLGDDMLILIWYTSAMKLFLVRHGETDANRILGHGVSGPMHDEPVTFKPGDDTNIPLNIYGRTQAREAAEELPSVINRIYSSKLLRVKETAGIIAETKKIDPSRIELRDELLEYHQGSLEGLSTEQKKARLAEGQSWGSGSLCEYDYSPWGGDSAEIIRARLESFLKELKAVEGNGNIICVTSGGTIRMTYKILFSDRSPGITKHVVIKNGSVHEFIL